LGNPVVPVVYRIEVRSSWEMCSKGQSSSGSLSRSVCHCRKRPLESAAPITTILASVRRAGRLLIESKAARQVSSMTRKSTSASFKAKSNSPPVYLGLSCTETVPIQVIANHRTEKLDSVRHNNGYVSTLTGTHSSYGRSYPSDVVRKLRIGKPLVVVEEIKCNLVGRTQNTLVKHMPETTGQQCLQCLFIWIMDFPVHRFALGSQSRMNVDTQHLINMDCG